LEKSCENFQKNKNKNEEWNLSLEVENFRVRENNRVHAVTKFKPNEVIILKDKIILSKVQVSIEQYYQKETEKNKETILETLKKDTRVFIVKNVIPNRNHTKLIKAPETKLSKRIQTKIPAIIMKSHKEKDTSVKIQIVATIKENLKLKNIYSISLNFLSLPDKKAWEIMVEREGKFSL